ncbi:MAG: hypothetical protein IH948_05055 [Bacteroidetes bacterium]|nr:hypothetical protein [Bacteroidota bacterium]
MKKLILLFLLLPVFASAQIVNIPDANFKAALVADISINTNGDGEIQVSEASVFTGSINVGNDGISDLTGIEAFTALEYLWCFDNSLTSLDVSNNIALTELNCRDNSLSSLDVSNNVALTYLECQNNSLTILDVSNNTALTTLWCYSNSLTSLDVRNGNNINMPNFYTINNSLACISVDDEVWSAANWTNVDGGTIFSDDCLTVGINEALSSQVSITSFRNTIQIKGKGTATIYNLTGQRVHQTKLSSKTSVSLDKASTWLE